MPGLEKNKDAGVKGYLVCGQLFPTKEAVGDACRTILYGYLIGQTISDTDSIFLIDLLMYHRHRAGKIGDGVASIQVEQNPRYPSQRTFWLSRVDGTRTDFSFKECITTTPHATNVKAALRHEIVDQILAAKNAALPNLGSTIVCTVTGDVIGVDDCHVDHEPPMTFDIIVEAFLESKGISAAEVLLEYADNDIGDHIVDQDLASAWRPFHAAGAKLRVISKRANLSVVVKSHNAVKRERPAIPAK